MNCGKCRYEFCWACLGRYISYRHDNGMEQYCAIRKIVSVGIYLIFIAMFFIVKLLVDSSRGEESFLNKAPILDRINAGESLLTRENFLVTLGTFLLINVYAIATFVVMIIFMDNHRIPPGAKFVLVISTLISSVLFAMSFSWLQFGAQIFFFEIIMLIGAFAGFWASMAVFILGIGALALKLVLWAIWGVFYVGKMPFSSLLPSWFSSSAPVVEPIDLAISVEAV
jgi:hypothetical protein